MKRSSECSNSGKYLLLVLRGLEFLAVQEIEAKLQVETLTVITPYPASTNKSLSYDNGDAAVGKIILRTSSPVGQVLQLKCVQAVLSYLGKNDNVNIREETTGINDITSTVKNGDWENALDLWSKSKEYHQKKTSMLQFNSGERKAWETTEFTFRASCVRDGGHVYKSIFICGEVGGEVLEKFPKWKVNLKQFDVEVVTVLLENYLLCGLSLACDPKSLFKQRMPAEYSPHLPFKFRISTLRPSTACMMLQLADIKHGDFVLDNMCGIGTIPILAQNYSEDKKKKVISFGGELDVDAVLKAKQNLLHMQQYVQQTGEHCLVSFFNWDSTRIPLREGTVDAIVVDMPFGVSCGTFRLNNKIYPKIFNEMARVLRKSGRAVILALSKKMVLNCVNKVDRLTISNQYDVNIGGLMAFIFVIVKSED